MSIFYQYNLDTEVLELPFSVVELEDGVVLISTKWIFNREENDELFCYYPPTNKTTELNEMVSKLIDPNITWNQYTILKYLKKTSKCKYLNHI